jgi:transposase InsO family protein
MPASAGTPMAGWRAAATTSTVDMMDFRTECLNAHWFLSLADAKEKVEDWRKYYNKERSHGAATDRRFCCITTMTQPARHREKSAKL